MVIESLGEPSQRQAARWSARIGCIPSGHRRASRRILYRPRFRYSGLSAAASRGLKFLELGRSCVLRNNRPSARWKLLWHQACGGVCAPLISFRRHARLRQLEGHPGGPAQISPAAVIPASLRARRPAGWQASSHPSRRIDINMMRNERSTPRRSACAAPLITVIAPSAISWGDGSSDDIQLDDDVLILMCRCRRQRALSRHILRGCWPPRGVIYSRRSYMSSIT